MENDNLKLSKYKLVENKRRNFYFLIIEKIKTAACRRKSPSSIGLMLLLASAYFLRKVTIY